MRNIITFFTILIMSMPLSVVNAQSISKQATVVPMAGHDTSIELKNITPHIPSGNPENIENEQDWGKDPFGKNFSQPPANDPVVQGMKGTKGTKGAAINFAGLNNSDNGSTFHAPPDTDGDIGPNHYFQTVNTSFEIFDRDGTSLYGPAGVTTIFDGFSGEWTGLSVSDPIILYDEQADRWFFSVFTTQTGATSGNYYILIAVSQTSDPTGSYYRYAFPESAMPDYAKWAVWPNGYFMGANVHSGYDNFVFDRSQMLLGNSAGGLKVDNGDRPNYSSSFHAVLPADCDGPFPPSSTPAYYVTINDDAWPNNTTDRLMIWEFSVNWSPIGGTWTLVQSINTAAFDTYFSGGFHDNIEQPGTTQKLDALSQVLMNRVQYRYIGGQGRIVCNHTVDVGTDHAGIRWYELRKTGSNPWTKYQESTYAPDADNRWMGSIAMNENGDIALGYTVSGSSTYPSIRFTGRNSGDALNSMTIVEQSIQVGANSQTTGSRWGDYSSMRIDPNDGTTFWCTNEYVESSSGWYPWATRIAAFSFNTYCAASGTNCGGTDEYISRVQFGEIDNQTDCDNYTDYSITQVNEIPINAAEDIIVTNGSASWSTDQCGIWVDWNNDGDFDDAGESITVSDSPGIGPYTASIDPPSSVSIGDEFIMRVRIVYNATPSPCGTTSYGEVEDYKITIGDMVPNEWTGAFNHYWHNANNWSLGHIPTADEDVIITTAGYQPVAMGSFDEECNDLTINSGTSLDIRDNGLTINDNIVIDGGLNATVTGGVITCYNNVFWNSGSTADFSASSVFWVYGNWNFNSGANVQLVNGNVDFTGSKPSWIRSYESNCSFNNIGLYKSALYWTRVSDLSTEDLTINGGIYLQPDANFGISSSHNVILKGTLLNWGTFDFTGAGNTGTFVFDGTTQSINMYTPNGTFNNVKFSSSGTTSTTGDLTIKGDLTIESGSFSLAGHKISIEGDWKNLVGDAGFTESGRVVFDGGNYHQYCTSEHFDTLEIAKVAGGAFRPFGSVAYNIVCEHYDWTAGAIDIVAGGSTFTANDLIDNGIFGAFYLNSGGTINLTNNDGYVDLDGDLHIFGGTMNVYGGTSYSYWSFAADASITMSDGILDFHDKGINIYNSGTYTLTENITGGTIRTSQGFSGNRADFTPTAGTFEFYGSNGYSLSQSYGCTLFNVNIEGSKSADAGAQGKPIFDVRSKSMISDGGKSNTNTLSSDFVITNSLTITSGGLTLGGHTLSVAHSCGVSGTLTMDNSADILNVGTVQPDILMFYSGSVGNITNGVINLPYALWLDSGSSFIASTDNTIYFGNTLAFGGIYNGSVNTLFGNITVDMLPGNKWILDNTSTAPFVVNGDFAVMPNNIVEMRDQTLVINGNLSDVSSSAIYVYDGPVKGKGENSLLKEPTGQEGTKAKGGYLEIDNDFTLNGLMDLGADGTVLAHGHFGSAASGVLTISGGSLTCDVTDGISGLNGTYNISDGLLEYTDSHIGYYGTPNITGGLLRAGRTVFASDDGLQANGGTFELFGSKGGNYIQPGANTYLNDLVFNKTSSYIIYPQNTANPLVVKGNVTINSGTLSSNGNDMFVGGNWINNAGSSAFNETTGTVTFNEAGDVTVSNETFYNLTLNKPGSGEWLTLTDDITVLNDLTIDGGALHTSSNIMDVNGDASINTGILFVQAGGTLKIGDYKTLTCASGAKFYIEGSSSNYATLTHSGTGRYDCSILGEIAANYAVFEYLGQNGVFVKPGAIVNPVYTFNHCIFMNGAPAKGSAYLVLNSDNIFTSTDTYFENTNGDVGNNVWKGYDTGSATFENYSGDFAGPEFEHDPYNRIHWGAVDVEMSLTVMLEGSYNGTDMNTDLNALGLIPLSQPFSSIPTADWYYTGTESVGSIPPNVVDWVLVQIRDAGNAASADGGTVVAEQAAFLLNDGSIVDLDGSSNLYFPGIAYSSGLFPVVWHRNHLGVISANKMMRTGGVYTYDFTQFGSAYSSSNAGETNLGGGVYGLWGGDGNGSGWVHTSGEDITWWKDYAGESNDYFQADYDMNNQVDNKDKNDVFSDSFDMRSQIPGSKENSGDDKN